MICTQKQAKYQIAAQTAVSTEVVSLELRILQIRAKNSIVKRHQIMNKNILKRKAFFSINIFDNIFSTYALTLKNTPIF